MLSSLVSSFECLLVTRYVFPPQQIPMVLTAIKHPNQAKAEATSSKRCAVKIEEGANTFTSGGETSIGSVSVSNTNIDSGSMAFGSDNADAGDTGSITVGSSNAQLQAGIIAMASSSMQRRVIMPRVSKGLCDQTMTNPDISATIRTKDMDNSTETGVTRKRNAEDSSTNCRKKGTAARTGRFEERYTQLIEFIDEFGHCNVPYRYSANPPLGYWCSIMRRAYNQVVQQGKTTKHNLTEDQIERLEDIGFKLICTVTFEQRCHELEAFKGDFGHCNVPHKSYSVNPSLVRWCSKMRCA